MSVCVSGPVHGLSSSLLPGLSILCNEARVGAVQDFMRVRRHLRRARLFISVGIDSRAPE